METCRTLNPHIELTHHLDYMCTQDLFSYDVTFLNKISSKWSMLVSSFLILLIVCGLLHVKWTLFSAKM